MNIDQPTAFIKNVSVIIGVVIGGWFALEAIFETRERAARHNVIEVEREIDNAEKIRDHYERIQESVPLDKHQSRRLRTTSNKLDRLYDELDSAEEMVGEYE